MKLNIPMMTSLMPNGMNYSIALITKNNRGEIMITEKLRASLEQMLRTYFTEDWTVQKRQNKLIISWQ